MQKGCVLYVEDDPQDIELMQWVYKQSNAANPLQIAHDGDEAIEYLSGKGAYADRQHYPEPSLVLLDLKMPGKNGLDVLAWMRQQPEFRCTPIVMFSSSMHDGDIHTAYENGVNAYCVKPSTLAELNTWFAAMRDFWLKQNHRYWGPECHLMKGAPQAAK